VYGGIREIFLLHHQPASIKHKHQKNHVAASSNTNDKCLPDAIVNLLNTTYPGSQLIVVGSPYDLAWRSTHTTVASSNGSDITCEITTSHFSTHHTKSLSSGRTSLRSLLTLNYVLRKIKIPTNHVPHECRFCPLVNPYNTPFGASHQRPFEYILPTPRSRGRPRRETVLQVSSQSESESESEFDSEDLVENSDTDNSVFNPGSNSDTNNSSVIRITRL